MNGILSSPVADASRSGGLIFYEQLGNIQIPLGRDEMQRSLAAVSYREELG
jgi:hypothetical protein